MWTGWVQQPDGAWVLSTDESAAMAAPRMANVRVYERALSKAEINQIYESERHLFGHPDLLDRFADAMDEALENENVSDTDRN